MACTPTCKSADYIRVTLAIQPTSASSAEVAASLQAALQDGRLAAALAMVGVQLASSSTVSVQVLSSAVPSDNRTAVGVGVGVGVGGAAVLVIAAAVFLVQRRRRLHQEAGAGHRRDELPVSAFLAEEEAGGMAKAKVGVTRGCSRFEGAVNLEFCRWAVAPLCASQCACVTHSPAGVPAPQGPEPDRQGGASQWPSGPCVSLRQHAPQRRPAPPSP